MRLCNVFFIGVFLSVLVLTGCSEKVEVNIPEYPNAVEDQEVKAEMLGMDFGSVRRVFTSDSFDTVFVFYKEHLREYDPEIMSHTLEDGRQAAFTIMESKKSNVTVAVQEFKKEGQVAISYMKLDMDF